MSFAGQLEAYAEKHESATVEVFRAVRARGSEMMPQWTVIDRAGVATVIGGTFGDPDEKDAIANAVKQYAEKAEAVMVAGAMEAWGSRQNAGDDERVAPAEDPDRVEMLVLQLDTALWSRTIIWEIDTGSARLGKRQEVESISGRFSGLCARLDS